MNRFAWVCKRGQVENQKIVKVETQKSGKVGIWKSRKLVFFGKVKNRKLENCKSGKLEKWEL